MKIYCVPVEPQLLLGSYNWALSNVILFLMAFELALLLHCFLNIVHCFHILLLFSLKLWVFREAKHHQAYSVLPLWMFFLLFCLPAALRGLFIPPSSGGGLMNYHFCCVIGDFTGYSNSKGYHKHNCLHSVC